MNVPLVPRLRAALVALGLLLAATACGAAQAQPLAGQPEQAQRLRLGYLATLTQATAVYGVATGGFQRALGPTELSTSVFRAGPAVVEAMRGGSLDAAFVGPNPAINGYVQTGGRLLRVVAGTMSGGAALVVQPSIRTPRDLVGVRLATPQLGNTQDVAAKSWLRDQDLQADVVNQPNSQTLDLFKAGRIAAAWVPEPWVSRLVLEGGGHVLLDEASLWPGGRFVTTQLVVRQEFLAAYPETVTRLLRGLIAADAAVATTSAQVQRTVDDALAVQTGKHLKPKVLAAAFARLTPTLDPLPATLRRSARQAVDLGLLPSDDLTGLYDLSLLAALLPTPLGSSTSPSGARP